MPQTVVIAPWVAILVSLAALVVLVSQVFILPALGKARTGREKILNALTGFTEKFSLQDRKISLLEEGAHDDRQRISALERMIAERTENTRDALLSAAQAIEKVTATANRVEVAVNGRTKALTDEIESLKQALTDMKALNALREKPKTRRRTR